MYRQFDWICQRHQCCISAHGRSELYHPSAAQFEQVCVLGGYGAFDSLAASVLRKQKKRYPQIELVLVLAYLKTRQDISYYDSTVYPPLEAVPRRFACDSCLCSPRLGGSCHNVAICQAKKETDYFLCRKIGKTAEATLLKGYYDAHNRCLSVCSKRPHCRLIHPRVFAYE